MLKINQRASGLRFTSLGSGGTNGETKSHVTPLFTLQCPAGDERRHMKRGEVTALHLLMANTGIFNEKFEEKI